MSTRWNLVAVGICAALTCAVSGCGGPTAASLTLKEIKGTVKTADDKPVDRTTMRFTPIDAAVGREDVCLVEKGQFVTKLITGKYKVSFEPLPGGTYIPQKYSTKSTTLELNVDADKEEHFVLK